jgi:hypothetical protein
VSTKENTEMIRMGHQALDKIRESVAILDKMVLVAEVGNEPALANSLRHFQTELELVIISDDGEAGLFPLVQKL